MSFVAPVVLSMCSKQIRICNYSLWLNSQVFVLGIDHFRVEMGWANYLNQ